MSDLYGHPVFGASWEGWCIEQILSALPLWRPGFYRTPSGEELDLFRHFSSSLLGAKTVGGIGQSGLESLNADRGQGDENRH